MSCYVVSRGTSFVISHFNYFNNFNYFNYSSLFWLTDYATNTESAECCMFLTKTTKGETIWLELT